jgi:putative methionine-R-sulfoxide reductase with GAF domain
MTFYSDLEEKCEAIIDASLPVVSTLSNISALVYEHYNSGDRAVNWAGFYLSRSEMLYLGPYQGKVACTVIPFGKGVCGTAAMTKERMIVGDVHSFQGHIACSSASMSELVVPIIQNGQVLGVFDMDCLFKNGFDERDGKCIANIITSLVDQCNGIWLF